MSEALTAVCKVFNCANVHCDSLVGLVNCLFVFLHCERRVCSRDVYNFLSIRVQQNMCTFFHILIKMFLPLYSSSQKLIR